MRLFRDGEWLVTTALLIVGIAVLLYVKHPTIAIVIALYWVPLSFLRWWFKFRNVR